MIELKFLKVLMLLRQVHKKVCYLPLLAFLDKRCKFQPDICNGCHDVLMMSVSPSNIAILNLLDVDYRCNINGFSESEAINLLQNTNLNEKNRTI